MVLWSVSKLFVLMSIFAVFATVSSKPSRLSRMSAVARSSPTTAPSKPLKQFNMRTASKRARNVAAQPEASPSLSNFVSSNLKVDGRINTGTLSSTLSNAATSLSAAVGKGATSSIQAGVSSSVFDDDGDNNFGPDLSGLRVNGATNSVLSDGDLSTPSEANVIGGSGPVLVGDLPPYPKISSTGSTVLEDFPVINGGKIASNDLNTGGPTTAVSAIDITNPGDQAIPAAAAVPAELGVQPTQLDILANKDAPTVASPDAAQLDVIAKADAAQPANVDPQAVQVDVQTNNGPSSRALTEPTILVVRANGDSTTSAPASSAEFEVLEFEVPVPAIWNDASSASSAQPAPAPAKVGSVDASGTSFWTGTADASATL